MSATPPTPRLTRNDVRRALVERSFPDFLLALTIRSDDPQHPEPVPLRPWPFQVERARAWEAGASEVILKERQLGFSAALVAPYLLWRAMYHGWTCGYWSVDQPAAREQLRRIRAMYEDLPAYLRDPGTVRVDDASFASGGRIIAFPSSDHAGISYTLQLAVMDEAAFHPYGGSNYAAIQPAVSRGQLLILSTADPTLGTSGFFWELYWSSSRGETPYTAVFEARRRPDRDEAWYERARRAYAGQEDAYHAYYPRTAAEAFAGRHGLVYPTMPVIVHADPLPWEDFRHRVAGVDFGGGDPTAVIPIGVSSTGRFHQPGEFYRRGMVDISTIGAYLMDWHARAPFLRVYCDPSEPVAIASLRSAGLPAVPADNKRDGIGLVGALYAQGRMTIHADCRESLAEFAGYRWAERTDPGDRTRYATSTPVDHHGDAHDARRYAVVAFLRAEAAARRDVVEVSMGQRTGDHRTEPRSQLGVAQVR